MKIEIPGVDVESGLNLCDGDTDVYLNILRLFVSDMIKALDKVRNVSEETMWDYSVSVHTIKSVSQAIGAEEARKTAKHLEELAKNGDLTGIKAKNDVFVRYADNLVESVQAWLAKYDAAERIQ